MEENDVALAHLERMGRNVKLGYLSILERKGYELLSITYPDEDCELTNKLLDMLTKIEHLRRVVDG